jgi:hypothetical protein
MGSTSHGAEAIFANGSKVASADAEAREAELYEQIGRLKMELECSPITRGQTNRWATGPRQRSTGHPDDAGWMRGPRRAAGSWSEMGANGVPRGLPRIGAYPGRAVTVRLVKSHSLPDRPRWHTPE